MSLEEINKYTKSNKQLLNNLNDFIIQIDYFDQMKFSKATEWLGKACRAQN